MSGKRVAVFFLLLGLVFEFVPSTIPTPILAAPTYYRGYNFESYDYLNGIHRTIFGLPEWVWNGSAYVPYIFDASAKAKDSGDDCFLVRTGLIAAEIMKGYPVAKFWDVNYTDVRLYEERWTIEYYKANQWKDTGVGAQTPTYTYVTNSSGVYITRMQSLTGVGQLNVTYAFRVGMPLKHTVVYKNLGSSTYEFRVKQSWSGIVGDRVKYQSGSVTGEYIIASAVTVNSLWFEFRKADESLSVFEDQWNTGQVINGTYRNYVLQPTVIDVHAQGMKADFLFQNSTLYTLSQGKTLKLDPTTYTFQPPTADAYINDYGDASGTATMLVVQSMYQESSSNNYRSLLKFDMSGQIVSGSVVTSATLSLYDYQNTGARTYWVYRITQTDWTETDVTWVNRYSGAPWTTAGGTYTTTNGSSASISSSTGWKTWTVTDQVQYAVNYVSKVAHFLVKDATENSEPGVYHYFYSKEYSDTTLRPKLDVTWTPPNTAPTNDALTLDLTGASYKGTKTLLAGKQGYKFIHQVTDADDVNDINYAEIRLDYATKNVILRATRTGTDTWSMAEQSDPSNYVTITSTSHSTSGNQKTFNWWVQINWNWDDASETLGVRAYVIDSASASDQDDYTNVFGVENDLSSSSLSVNDYRCSPSQTLTFSGCWYYDGTSIPPPDGDYQVKVKLSGVQKGSTDTTLVSGAFSISDVTAESTVGSYSYTVEATYMASAGSFSAVIVDVFNLKAIKVADARVDVGSNVDLWFKVYRAYDDAVFSAGTVYVNGTAATWDAAQAAWKATVSQNSVTGKVYAVSAISDTEYGITTVNSMMSFDGSNDYVEVPHSTSLNPDHFTIEAWIRGKVFQDREPTVIQKGATFAYPGYAITIFGGGHVRFNIGRTSGESIIDSQAVLATNTWYHITVVYDGVQKIYVNGVKDPAEATPSSYEKSTEPFWIGWDKRMQTASFAWDDTIDEVRIYNRVLSASEVEEHYRGVYSNETGLVLYLSGRMSGSTLSDESGQGNHGTIYGAVPDATARPSARIIWDRIKITGMGNDDGRRDVGTTGTFWATAVLEYDNHALGSGDSLTISGKSMTWVAGNSRFEATDSKSTVQAVTYDAFTSGSEATYGITSGTMNGLSTTIIWDRVKVVSYSVADTRVNINANVNIDATLQYAYDSTAVTDGSVTINGYSATHQGSGVWRITRTSASVTGVTYDTVAASGNTYGITSVDQNGQSILVVWDRIRVDSLGVVDGRIDVGTQGTWYATASLAYDGHALGSGDSLSLGGYAFTWVVGNNRFEATDTKATVQQVTVNSFSSGTESTYGITVGDINGQSGSIIWDRMKVTGYSRSDDRTDVGTVVNINATVTYEYDSAQCTAGTLTINGISATHLGSGVYRIQPSQSSPQSVTYNTVAGSETAYGLSAVNQNGQSTSVVWDRMILSAKGVDDDRRDVGTQGVAWFKIRSEYDGAFMASGSVTINGTIAASYNAGNARWEITRTKASVQKEAYYPASVSWDTYGITALASASGNATSIIWDRMKVTAMARSDDRIDVGMAVNVDATVVYEYDSNPVTTGTLTINSISASHIGSGVYRISPTQAAPTSVTYNSVVGSESTYGLSAVNMNGQSTSVIWDRLVVSYKAVDDDRRDMGTAGEVRFKLRSEYDGSAVAAGSASINGTAATWDASNSWWKLSVSQTSVTKKNYVVSAVSWSTYGITALNSGVAANATSIIWDRIKITGMGNDDGRRDIGTTGTFWATAVLEYDNHALGSEDSLTISGKSMTWVAGNSRFEATDSESTVQAVTYNTFTSGNEATYGITAGNMAGYSTTIIWDRFEFVSVTVDDSRINVGGTFELRYQIRYDYDDVIFDNSKGSISGFVWDSANSWWDKSVTGSSSVTSTNYDETYVSITDSTYGLAVKQDVAGVNVVTDRIKITGMGNDDGRRDVGTTGTFWATAVLEYDNHALGSEDSLTIQGKAMTWSAGNYRFEATDSQSSPTSVTYSTFTSGNEATYGITAGTMNGYSTTIVWDRIILSAKGVDDDRRDVSTTGTAWFKIRSEYDNTFVQSGSVTINGSIVATWNAGQSRWEITRIKTTTQKEAYYPASVNWDVYGITALTSASGNTTSIIWDRIRIDSLGVVDGRIDINAQGTFYATASLEYDGHALGSGDSLSLGGYSFSWVAGNSRFEYSTAKPSVQALTINSYTSGSEATYGITVGNINGKSGAIIWDRVKVTDKGVTDDRVDVNSYEQYWFKLASEYDDSAVEAGSVTLNGTLPMNWVAGRSRWEYNVTKSSAQKLALYPASVSWSTYGVTALSDQSSNTTSIIWDGLKVDSYSIDMASSKAYAHMKYSYDDAQVSSGTVSLAGREASTNSTGWASFDFSTGSDFNWSQRAYGVQDASYGITYKAQNQTLPIAKKSLFIQSDVNASSLAWDGVKLTVGFTTPAGSYTLKVSGTRPTYVMGTAYDLSTSYTTYLTLSHDGSKNITVSYATWGDLYVRGLSQGWMTDIYWTGQTLTMVLNGTSGSTGTLTVYCGSRGLPNAFTGLSGTEYSTTTKILSGIYQFASPTTVTMDWTASGSSSSGGGLVSTVSLFIAPTTLKAQQGQSVDAALEFTWTGVNQIMVTGVRFQGPSGWIALAEGLPKTVTKQVGEMQGKGSVAIRLIVPADAKQGDYSVPVEVDAEALGGRVTANGWVNFAVGQQTHPAGPVSDLMTYVFAVIVLVFVLWAYFRR